MKLVAISDTHCRHHSIRLPKGDLLLHTGDISYKGQKEEISDFLTWFGKQDFPYKIFIGGNHDFFLEKAKAKDIENLIPEGVTYLNDSGITIDGIKFWGSPVTPWFYNWAFNRHRGESIRKHWDLIPEDTNVLLTHGPAYGYLDTVINGEHVGCRDLLQKLLLVKPKVHVFGHIHESFGNIVRSNIRFINACQLNEQYELSNKPVAFEIKP